MYIITELLEQRGGKRKWQNFKIKTLSKNTVQELEI